MCLDEVAELVKGPELKPQTLLLRGIADKAAARAYKGQNFPYITPSGVFTYCNDASLVKHSKVLCIDLDGVEDVEALKRKLIADGHFVTLMAFRSPSGNGLKWFILIDLSLADHRTWFHAVRNYLLETYSDCLTEKMVDRQCQNLSRACFLCHDPEIYTGNFTGDCNATLSKREPTLLCTFDPNEWVKKTQEAPKPTVNRHPSANSQPLHPMEELAKARAVTRELLRKGANIADDYGDYLKLGFALANGLGNEGRELYHQLCSQSSKYRESDCERKWQQCLRQNDGRTTLATFYNMAKQAGVDLSSIAREFKQETIYKF